MYRNFYGPISLNTPLLFSLYLSLSINFFHANSSYSIYAIVYYLISLLNCYYIRWDNSLMYSSRYTICVSAQSKSSLRLELNERSARWGVLAHLPNWPNADRRATLENRHLREHPPWRHPPTYLHTPTHTHTYTHTHTHTHTNYFLYLYSNGWFGCIIIKLIKFG